MTRILIADDQPEVRSALRFLLEQQPSIEVIGEIDNNDDLISWLEQTQPDLVLLDWELSGRSSENTIPELRRNYPGVATIVLDSKPQTEKLAIRAGAAGFMGKNEPAEKLLAIIAALSNQKKGEN